MSNLNISRKFIIDLLGSRDADFLVPDYQRPYAWEYDECQTLWEDVFSFAFPDNDCEKFNTTKDEYFLGPIVTFINEAGQKEIIDGQQRLTTLMLLLRAFYNMFDNMMDKKSQSTKEMIATCLWKKGEFNDTDQEQLKIISQVATDDDKDEFIYILKNGKTKDCFKSRYALNFKYFQEKIRDFLQNFPNYFKYLPARILNNCSMLPIEANSQDTALRIFSTLNNRGKPLSDADIFKAELYKFYRDNNEKKDFIEQWKDLETQVGRIFKQSNNSPMDELFTRYMYYLRSLKRIKVSTIEGLRKFYEKDNYNVLKSKKTFEDLIQLADFWEDISNQNIDRFSNRILRLLFVLNYAPNRMWTYFITVYFMHNRDENGYLEDDKFYSFLNKTIAFIWAYSITTPGVNALRTPIFFEMINIIDNKDITFSEFKFDEKTLRSVFDNYSFLNGRPITKSMLALYAFQDSAQDILSLDTKIEIEHIYAKNRYKMDEACFDNNLLESLGNKILLEKRINIRASDYRFSDKIKHYQGIKGKKKASDIVELKIISKYQDFAEQEIRDRYNKMKDTFINYLRENNLLK